LRDARIFSIYEGTTQLQVVAAIRYITNGTYISIIREMLENEVSEEMKPLKARVEKLLAVYEEAVEKVKECGNQEVVDFLARRLYEMTAGIVFSLLLIDDASKAPELFSRSANVFVRLSEADSAAHKQYIDAFLADTAAADTLASFRAE
ncbi:MAG: acyl-CoA dehydrogenase, partial [Bacteroidales bacterium]|nr:acyl-CoA dehydrogenase [Bacteroidales bacterium]